MNPGLRRSQIIFRIHLLILPMLVFCLAACQQTPVEIKATNTSTVISASQTPFTQAPQVTFTPVLTATTKSEPSATATLEISQPGLGVEQDAFLELFSVKGFKFYPPMGFLTLSKEQGHLYDLDLQVSFTGSADNLQRMEMLICTFPPMQKEQMKLIADYLHLFHYTVLPFWSSGSEWLDTNLARLKIGEQSKVSTKIGDVNAQLTISPLNSADNPEGICYTNTFWVDPVSAGVGENIHLSVEIHNRPESDDEIKISCWDFEDPASATWTSVYSCDQLCDTNHPNVKVSRSKIIVYEGFPVTHDQWSIHVMTEWGSQYKENELIISVVFHDRSFKCTNRQELGGQEDVGVWVNGEKGVMTDDPKMICQEQ